MDFQGYLGIGGIVVGLAMSAREIARRDYVAALSSAVIVVMGVLFLTASIMGPGRLTTAALVGIIVVGLSIRFAISRLDRKASDGSQRCTDEGPGPQWVETKIRFTGSRSNTPTGERIVRKQIVITALAATLLVAGAAFAAPRLVAAAPLLMHKDVIGMPGKEVRVVIVNSPPGASSPLHRHNAQVFVYMLSGKMTMQVKGSSPVTLGPGQTFYEGPEDIHSMSRNASNTEPAQFLAFMIMDKRAPVSVPVK